MLDLEKSNLINEAAPTSSLEFLMQEPEKYVNHSGENVEIDANDLFLSEEDKGSRATEMLSKRQESISNKELRRTQSVTGTSVRRSAKRSASASQANSAKLREPTIEVSHPAKALEVGDEYLGIEKEPLNIWEVHEAATAEEMHPSSYIMDSDEGSYTSLSEEEAKGDDDDDFFDLLDSLHFSDLDTMNNMSLSESEETEPQLEPINRLEWYAAYYDLFAENTKLNRTNSILNKRCVSYFKNKKMEHVYHPDNPIQVEELQDNYKRKLKEYDELKISENSARMEVEEMLLNLQKEKLRKENILTPEFDAMMHREKEIATGLISSTFGKPISEKRILYLINRQIFTSKVLTQMRVKFLLIRDKVNEMIVEFKKIDIIGDGLRMSNYEHMQLQYGSNTDKIEERDEQLDKLRIKCKKITQTLAHMRDKAFAISGDKEDSKITIVQLMDVLRNMRENTAAHKVHKTYLRKKIAKLKSRTGLLFHTALLKDYELCEEHIKTIKEKIHKMETEFNRDNLVIAKARCREIECNRLTKDAMNLHI